MDQAAAVSPTETEKRRYQRTPVALFGRCLLNNDLEIPCQAVDISPGDVSFVSAHKPRINEHVIVYLDHVGRIEGPATRHFDGGFCMEIECTPRKREKLSARIEWLKAHKEFKIDDQRRFERIEPRELNSQLKLPDGRSYPIQIIDISLSGAAVAVDVKPAVGSVVWLAGMQGTVVRHFAEGIGLDFINIAQHATLDYKFGMPKRA